MKKGIEDMRLENRKAKEERRRRREEGRSHGGGKEVG